MVDAGEKVVFWTGVLALGRIDRLSAQLISDLEADTAEMAIGAIGQTPGAAGRAVARPFAALAS